MPRWLAMALFLSLLLVVLGGLHLFVYRRIRAAFAPGPSVSSALAAVLFSGPLCLVLGRVLASTRGGPEAAVVAMTVYGAVETLAVVLAAALLAPLVFGEGVVALVRRRLARERTSPPESPGADDAPSPAREGGAPAERLGPREGGAPAERLGPHEEAPLGDEPRAPDLGAAALPRRAFVGQITTAGALLVAGGTSLHGGLFGRHDYQLEDVPIVLPRLPRALDGYTIVQLSDIHVGTFVQEPELRSAEALVRKARPDLVVLTGDLVDHDPWFAPKLGELVRRLGGLSRHGVVAVPGNHDYYAGVEVVLGAVRRAGAKVVVNAARVVGDRGGAFALVGVDDVMSARDGAQGPDLGRALAMAPRDLPKVLLCHNPAFFPEAAEHVDLQLSGHTHGGQIAFGINPAEIVLPHGYVRGKYREGESQLYVNRGFGTAGPPARIGSPPEVTRIVLLAG